MAIKLLQPRPWDEIQLRAARQKAFVAVPFIGKGAAKLLPLLPGSILVTRFSESTVRAGQVDPKEILKFLNNQVKVHANNRLHAKVYVFGKTCFIGSANASRSSRELIEACMQCTDPTVVKDARAMVAALATNLLTPEYVRSLVGLYPGERQFGGARSDQTTEGAPDSRPRVWVTPLVDEEWDEQVIAADRGASKVAGAKVDASTHHLFKAHWERKPSFAVGDWIVTRDGAQRGQFRIAPPARVISIEPVARNKGYLVYGERPKGMRARGSAAVERVLGNAASLMLYSGLADRAIRKVRDANAVLQMWSAYRA